MRNENTEYEKKIGPEAKGSVRKLTVALSTMGEKPESFRHLVEDLNKQIFKEFELLVVVQRANDNTLKLLNEIVLEICVFFPVRFLISDEIGLLKSRNLAIRSALGELILIADDDCRYFPESIGCIYETAIDYPESDILTFQAVSPQFTILNRKNRFTRSQTHTKRTIMSVCSIELVIRRSFAENRKPLFDDRFGLGTPFNTGGENIMLLDVLRESANVTRHPFKIVKHPSSSSGTGEVGLTQLAFAKGAMFRRMFGMIGFVFLAGFMLKGSLSVRPPRFLPWHYFHGVAGFFKAPVRRKGGFEK